MKYLILLLLPLFVLAANKIEINTASLEQLDEITGIGPAMAQRIIDARPFSSIDDLIRVKGIGDKTLQKIKDQGLAYIGEEITTTTELIEPTKVINEQIENTSLTVYPTNVIINEILPSPKGSDEENEWIEIYNQNDFKVDLSNWQIKDLDGKSTTYTIPIGTNIPSNGYLVFYRTERKITLNNTNDELNLIQPNGNVIDSVRYEKATSNQSYSKIDSNWFWNTNLTPGNINNISKKSSVEETKKLAETQPINSASIIKDNIPQSYKNTVKSKPVFLIALILSIFSGLIVLILKKRLD